MYILSQDVHEQDVHVHDIKRRALTAQGVLQQPRQLAVPVGHVRRLLRHVAQGGDHVAQGQLGGIWGGGVKEMKKNII